MPILKLTKQILIIWNYIMKNYIFIFCSLIFFITKTFALGNDILFFRYHDDVYKYDVASKKNSPFKLNNKNEKVKDITTSNKNTLYFISKNNEGKIKYKEEEEDRIRLRRVSFPDYSEQKNKITFSPDGKFFAIIKDNSKEKNIFFYKWKSTKSFLSVRYNNDAKNSYCFSPDSRFFIWVEINRKTKSGFIKKIDLISKEISKIAEVKTSMGFSNVLLSIQLYWTKKVLWVCSYPKSGRSPSYAFINSGNKLIKSNKKEFFMANNLSFRNIKGVWCYKNKQLHFLFGYDSFKEGAPAEWTISNSGNNIAITTNKALYILTLKHNNKIKIFNKYTGGPSGKMVWNKN